MHRVLELTVSSMINFDQVFQSTISFRSFSMHLLTCMNSGNLLTGVLYIESFSKLKFSSQFKNCTKNEIQICDKIPGNFATLLQTLNNHQILGVNLVCTNKIDVHLKIKITARFNVSFLIDQLPLYLIL